VVSCCFFRLPRVFASSTFLQENECFNIADGPSRRRCLSALFVLFSPPPFVPPCLFFFLSLATRRHVVKACQSQMQGSPGGMVCFFFLGQCPIELYATRLRRNLKSCGSRNAFPPDPYFILVEASFPPFPFPFCLWWRLGARTSRLLPEAARREKCLAWLPLPTTLLMSPLPCCAL